MEEAANRMNLVILDACRNNPFNRNFRSTSQGLAQVIAPAGSFISYATAPGEVGADQDWGYCLTGVVEPDSQSTPLF